MAEHPSRIYTRTGDKGSTGLSGGRRVYKDNMRIQAIGDIDELNCQLGLALTEIIDEDLRSALRSIQQWLFELGAELARPDKSRLTAAYTTRVENAIDRLSAELPPLRNFVLPGGVPPAARCHLARAVCRRAERRLVRLSRIEQVNAFSLEFVNRLSDLLFVMARTLNHRAGAQEPIWQSENRKP